MSTLPADGRNHKRTHRTEFNKRMGRWICGCGWKGNLRESARMATTGCATEEMEEGGDDELADRPLLYHPSREG
jgi:hypothetical protein